jgi:hypothetical protein
VAHPGTGLADQVAWAPAEQIEQGTETERDIHVSSTIYDPFDAFEHPSVSAVIERGMLWATRTVSAS